jgi:hypothetical protein
MKKGVVIVSLIAACLILFACGKRYVGQIVNTKAPAWHRVGTLPDQGHIANVGPLVVDFQIETGDGPGNYIVTGEFDASTGSAKSWSNILPEKSKFSMLIASEGMVVDNISFLVRGENLNQPLPFRITFHCDKPIEAVAFWYQFYMRG